MADFGGVKVDVKITTQSLNKFLIKLDKMVEGMSVEALNSLSQSIADKAWANFQTAQYDGPMDDIQVEVVQTSKRTFNVIASGQAVSFIEYGTGVVHKEPYPGKSPSGYQMGSGPTINSDGSWYFKDPNKNDARTEGATYYSMQLLRYKDERDYGDTITVTKKDKTKKTYDLVTYMTKYKKGKYAKWNKDGEYTGKVLRRRAVPIIRTLGNPPNACMYRAYKETLDKDLPKLAKKWHDWSSYD